VPGGLVQAGAARLSFPDNLVSFVHATGSKDGRRDMKRIGRALLTAAMALGAAGCSRASEPIVPDESRVAPVITPVVESAAPAPAPTPAIGGVFVPGTPEPPETAEPAVDDDADLESPVPAPPDPIVESPGPAPSADHHWVEGYWRWDASHYVWEPGYWVDEDDGAPYAPPAAPGEDPGYAPGDGYVFMGGYWRWNDGAYLWMGGHWAPLRNGFDYVRPRWERTASGRWSSRGGYWVPQSGAPRDDYTPAHPSVGEPPAAGTTSSPKPRAPSHVREGDTGGSTYGEGTRSLYGEGAQVYRPRPSGDARVPSREPRLEETRPEAPSRAPAGRGWPGRSGGSSRHGRR
jgi:hypothetical protein